MSDANFFLPIPHMLSVNIRKLTKEDLPELEWGGKFIHFRRLYLQHFQSMQNGKTLIYVAENKEVGIIGQIFILLDYQREKIVNNTKQAYIFSFRIKPEFRNYGLGTAMLNFIESELLKIHHKVVCLNVAKENLRAKKLYKELGYEVFGSDPGKWSYQDNVGNWRTVIEPAWRMKKHLK